HLHTLSLHDALPIYAEKIAPQVTWGTNPGMVTSVTERVPDPHDFKDLNDQKATESALQYVGLKAGTPIVDIPVDRVFIGSCTNSDRKSTRLNSSHVS